MNSELDPATPDGTLRDVISSAYACVMLLPGSDSCADSKKEDTYRELVELIVTEVAPPVEIAECSLRGTLLRAGADLDGARRRAEAQRGAPNAKA